MKITIDISMYPLTEDYKPAIIAFIERLRASEGIKIETNGISSQVYGEYDTMMKVIHREMKVVFEGKNKVSMVMKVINDDLSGPVKF